MTLNTTVLSSISHRYLPALLWPDELYRLRSWILLFGKCYRADSLPYLLLLPS